MTRKSRREIEREIADLQDDDDLGEIEVFSSVVTITEDMTDDRGNVIEEKVPEREPPEGYAFGEVVPTESPVVTVRELIPETSTDE